MEEAALAAALADPATYGGPGPVEVRDTHISRVFLAGDRAYKVKKPVVTPFLDQRSLASRRAACEAEVELNRRLAPGIYLGVRSVVAAGGGVALREPSDPAAVEYVVEMERFDERDTLDARVRAGAAGVAEVAALGAHLAAFHRAAPAADGGAEPVKRALDDTFATLRAELGADQGAVAAAERFATAFLTARWAQLESRAGAGQVREGHGDLRAEHVLAGDPPRVVDCVEFSRPLRTLDVGADLSFLVMDLRRLGRRDLADALLAGYRGAGGDPGDDGLLAFHAAQRARVRAKVALLRARQLAGAPAESARRDARTLLGLATRLDWAARTPLVVAVTGVAASGKSALAAALADRSGYRVISSDVERKAAAGLAPEERGGAGLYDAAHDRATYERICAAAVGGAADGAIVDATFRRRRQRDLLRDAVAGIPFTVVECRAPADVLRERAGARARGASVSDAGPDVVDAQLASREPPDELPAQAHVIVRTDRPVGEVADAVAALLDAALVSRGAPAAR
jgi:uncharacterized protein